AVQQRWQAEAQGVPLDRKHEQKLWDAFRKPLDDAFNRKGEERDRAAATLSDRDRMVLEASKALEAANATGDAQKIRAAMTALDAALRGQAQAQAAVAKAAAPAADAAPADAGEAPAQAEGDASVADGAEQASPAPAAPPKPAPKPVIAMRGDDRPGMKKTEPAQGMRGGRFGDRKPGAPPGRFGDRGGPGMGGHDSRGAGRFGDRDHEDRGPRLGDVAFRAQRDAIEHAQQALRKLAAQAHGEALTHLMAAWEQRDSQRVPSQSELGKGVAPAVRASWTQAVGAAPAGDASQALLRLEIASETPTPAEHIDARRAMQLQLLTRRNDPSPAQTWGQDVAAVFATPFQAQVARRLQNVLKTLLR
ncbi:MAG TPA: DUF349 domain-containing protein, partial [Burkholderiaceae bacterium]|nr:DUF349 domain-containing protein [Burkholderiaceae bacterium]